MAPREKQRRVAWLGSWPTVLRICLRPTAHESAATSARCENHLHDQGVRRVAPGLGGARGTAATPSAREAIRSGGLAASSATARARGASSAFLHP
jgi:hypothetical protein